MQKLYYCYVWQFKYGSHPSVFTQLVFDIHERGMGKFRVSVLIKIFWGDFWLKIPLNA